MPEITDDLFSIDQLNLSGEDIAAKLGVNAGSKIFAGHFPGQPVVPGACMLQIVKTVLELALKDNFRLKKAGQIKFTNVVIPRYNMQLQLNITFKQAEYGSYNISAKLADGDVICFKFQGSFVKE